MMPFGDGTGPGGMGPMTGRGAGCCAGFGRPGFANPVLGRGRFAIGFGWGMPYRYPYVGYRYPYFGRSYTPFYGYPYGYPAAMP